MNDNKNGWLVPVAFTNIYVIWGATFLAIAYGLQGFPPFILSGLRFLLAGGLIISWLLAKGRKANSWTNWRKNAIAGILILTGGTGLVAWGEQYVSSTEAAIAIATGPFWFIAIDRRNWNRYFADPFIPLGLLVGFAGLLLFLSGSVQHAHASGAEDITMRIVAFAVLALSSVSWVLGSLYSKNKPSSHSTFMNIAQQLVAAGVVALVIALFRGEWKGFDPYAVPVVSWLGLAFLVVLGSIVAYLSYIWLLSVRPAALVSTHTYINPIVAVLIGWLLAGERVSAVQLIGLLVILIGVLLTNCTKYIKLSDRGKVKVRRFFRGFGRILHPYRHAARFH